MANSDMYYALSLTAQGVSSTAYYGVTPHHELKIAQGSATVVPTGTGVVLVDVHPEELQLQSPPASLSAGVTIVTGAPAIGGHFEVSPAINVALVLTAYGAGGKEIGQAILDAGDTEKTFSFPVDGDQAMSAAEAEGVLKRLAAATA